MPFTPFHFGPALCLKAASSRRFSFIAFVLVQVVTDIETAVNMITGAPRLHTLFHSFVGSTIPITIGASLTPLVLRLLPKLKGTSRSVIWTSALIGGWSHVLLDGIMHTDMQPLWPISTANPFLDLVSLGVLHFTCFSLGVGGAFAWHFRSRGKLSS